MQDIKKQAVVVGRRCSLKIRIPGSSQSCRIGLSRGSREFALKNGRLRTPRDQDDFNPAWGVGEGAGRALPGGIRNGFFKKGKKWLLGGVRKSEVSVVRRSECGMEQLWVQRPQKKVTSALSQGFSTSTLLAFRAG